jgi:hypothetical protein
MPLMSWHWTRTILTIPCILSWFLMKFGAFMFYTEPSLDQKIIASVFILLGAIAWGMFLKQLWSGSSLIELLTGCLVLLVMGGVIVTDTM